MENRTEIAPETVRASLEAAGWRSTRQRHAVFEALRRADGHPTAEEVYRAVQDSVPQISLATVYKALEALERSGLATKLAGLDGSARFDGRSEDHYHLRCLRSGRVEDLSTAFDPDLVTRLDPGLADRLETRGFRVTGYRLELVGYYEGEERPREEGDDGD